MLSSEQAEKSNMIPLNRQLGAEMGGKIAKAIGGRHRKRHSKPRSAFDPTNTDGVLLRDIRTMLANNNIDWSKAANDMAAFHSRDRSVPWPAHREVELDICSMSASGLGLGLLEGRAVVVPATYPGDHVRARIHRTEEYYYEANLVEVLAQASCRDNSLIKCPYFGKCPGCQYQMLPYSKQLELKQSVLVNAFRDFAPELWASGRMPLVDQTTASPLQYHYRTKLTPHFDRPPKNVDASTFPIGFSMRGQKTILDIEQCPIGTAVVNEGLKLERQKVRDNLKSYKLGATLLLREKQAEGGAKQCITDPKTVNSEYVGNYRFEYKAGEFFQNNSSILPLVTEFVRNKIVAYGKPPRYLIDTYCGCGLFAITCSSAVEEAIGIEISAQNVGFARRNAEINNIKNATFIVGRAERIFEHVKANSDESAVVIDPPRKGCDSAFLDQLLIFKPSTIIYVSCNVHTQARDIEYICKRSEYIVESLGGFDFFPQTYHVEGLAVLRREQNLQ